MKKKLLVQCMMTMSLLFVSFIVVAQTRVLTGKVVDENASPLAGATIKVKGSTVATSSNAGGDFSVEIPTDAKSLEVSFIGYLTKDVPISGNDITIALEPNADHGLDEVVVIGYGTARKKDLTGAMVTIGAKDFNKGLMTSPDQLIQGKTPGVMVINNTGQPGGSTTVRIRGNSSIRASNNPLFVLDGVPMSGNSPLPEGRGGFSSDRGNPLTYLNPGDIASMDILKDASATAIYGSRGANGVVIITTKKGKIGSPEVSVGASTGISSMREYPDVLTAARFREALNYYTPSEAANADFGAEEDAFKAITRNAVTQNYYADVSGGTEHGKYRLSGGYLNQNGIIKGSQLKKYTANFTGNFRFLESKKLGLDFSVFLTQMDNKYAPINAMVGSEGNVISQALQWNPTRPIRDDQGNLTFVSTTTRNPLTSIEAFKDLAVTNTMVVNIAPYYKITDDLEYRFIYSAMRQTGNRQGMYRAGLIDPSAVNNEQAFISNNGETNLQMTHMLSYNKQINSDWNVNAVVGYEYLDYNFNNNISFGGGFRYMGLDYFDYMQYSPVATREISSYRSPTNQLQSLFARGGVNYLNRYLFTATVRRDGSTKFGENNKYAMFPSLALAWNIAEEEFLKSNGNLNQLKLRLGWGKTGNQEFPSGASLNRLIFGNQSISQANYGNDDLKWETSTTFNAGIDFGFLGNRIYGSIDYFNKKTTDALFEQTLAQPAPAGRIWVNLDGEIVNKGVEISLTGTIVKSRDWTWDLTGNATFLKNSVSGLVGYYETGALRGQGFSGVLGQRMVNGQPLNVWYLADYQGIDPQTGMSMYRGLDGSISSANDPAINKFYSNSPNPTTLLGISTNVSYKKVSLAANLNGAMGHYLFNNTAATTLGLSNLSSRNIGSAFFDTSVKESTSNSSAPSTRFLEKGDYLKLANLTLSYRVGDIGKTLKNLNVSLTGQNLFIITKYTGFDPEVNTDGANNGIPSLGIEYLPYPPARNILFGVNFSL
ncbi:TonB-linked outer membrane protein, SusC/RagA family [Sphingobacterium spiritivorum ATCC 33300]|uniref:TonB-linked outer membrane protein, SusC/RagA family n=1 Tax=Sphingobacterium spiritivorum ATCC 33300 TaxID=525372 RepID=C2G0I6_SPHSI|nr:SusC/RagA family TonB-linked outer membrane protein [Sphingobacterium spiritivorum]EEI91366.1 TonB-linked outer membrane protein, SusC/RagA family [Sphingobacterium spiritivorum ATCC 33300]QQS97464.1 SusC/RagA family TonB-linked outer membrane protein [Sphingobacterium spiritivorum]